jgi:hypothetical protein
MVTLMLLITFVLSQGRDLLLERGGAVPYELEARRMEVALQMPDGENSWLHMHFATRVYLTIIRDVYWRLDQDRSELIVEPQTLYRRPNWLAEEAFGEHRRLAIDTVTRMETGAMFEALGHAADAEYCLPPEDGFGADHVALRGIARTCSARMMMAAQREDWEVVLESFRGVLVAGRSASHDGTVIGSLTGQAIMMLAAGRAMDVMDRQQPPAEVLAAMQGELDRHWGLFLPRRTMLELDRGPTLGELASLFTDAGNGDGLAIVGAVERQSRGLRPRAPRSTAFSNLLGFSAASRRETETVLVRALERFDAASADGRGARARAAAAMREEAESLGWRHRTTRGLVLAAIQLREQLMLSFDLTEMHVLGVRTKLALERYEREHGEYPEKLESLVPRFLAAIDVDPVSQGVLRYRRGGAGRPYILYSMGFDGRDDGGRQHPENRRLGPREEGAGFDYVFEKEDAW